MRWILIYKIKVNSFLPEMLRRYFRSCTVKTANNDSEGKRRIVNVIRNVDAVSLIKLRDLTATLWHSLLRDCHWSLDLPEVLQRFYTSLNPSRILAISWERGAFPLKGLPPPPPPRGFISNWHFKCLFNSLSLCSKLQISSRGFYCFPSHIFLSEVHVF